MLHKKQFIFSPEQQLLIGCCKVHVGQKKNNFSAPDLLSEINENHFIELVDRHGVAPLIFHHLSGVPELSGDLKTRLKERALQIQIAGIVATSMIIKLQKQLDDNQLKGVFLKGIPLAAMYYGDIGLRHSNDIDLWVEKKGFTLISTFLKALGFHSSFDLAKFNQKQIAYKYITDHHVSFSTDNPEYPPVIELHWRLRGRFGFFTLDPENGHHQTIKHPISGASISVLNHIDHFLFLGSHGCEHAWYQLKWLFDLPQMISRAEFDWDVVYKRAIELNCLEQIQLTFLVLNRVLEQEIPSQFMVSPVKSTMKKQLFYIEHCIKCNEKNADTTYEKIQNLRYFLLLNKKGAFNRGIVLRYLSSESDWQMLPLPEKLFFLYFPLRPFLLALKLFRHRL